MTLIALALPSLLLLSVPPPAAAPVDPGPAPTAAPDPSAQAVVRAMQISALSGAAAGGLAAAIALGFGAMTWGLSPEAGAHPTRLGGQTWSPLFTTLSWSALIGGNVAWVTTLTSFLVQRLVPGE